MPFTPSSSSSSRYAACSYSSPSSTCPPADWSYTRGASTNCERFCNKKSPFELKRNIRAIRWAIPFSQASFLLPAQMGLSSLSTNKIFILQTNEARYRVAFAEFHYTHALRTAGEGRDFV